MASGGECGDDKFATYFRDSSSGLDYAINRYYDSSMGRFTTPDPSRRFNPCRSPQLEPDSYTGGDPVNSTDRSGLYWELLGDDGGVEEFPDGLMIPWRKCYHTSVEEYDGSLQAPVQVERSRPGRAWGGQQQNPALLNRLLIQGIELRRKPCQ